MNKINTLLISLLIYISILLCLPNTPAIGMITSNHIISAEKNNQEAPKITYNSKKNEYLVVWNDERNKNISGKDIFAKILDAKLEPKSDEFSVDASPNDQYVMDVDYNSIDDQYLVIWSDAITGDVQGQIVSSSGDLLGSKIDIANSVRPHTSSLAFNSKDDKFLVVWDEGDISQNSSDIYGQMLSRDGTLQAGKFPITASSFNQYNPVIAYNSNENEFLIAWQDERNTLDDVKYIDIYCKRITGLGQLISGDIPISDIDNNDYKQLPSIAYNKVRNEYLVVWTQGKSFSSTDICGCLVKSNGATEGKVIILCSAYGKQSNPDVAYNDEDMEYLIVWKDERGVNSDIYGQKLSHNGQLLGSNFAISTAIENQDYPKIVFNNVENSYLVVWNDSRNKIVNAGDIYGQIINSPSLLLEIKPDILYADGSSTAYVTLTLKGIFGEPLDREYVNIKVTRGQGTVGNITNNGDGTYTAIYTASNQAGLETITATALNKTKSIDITLIGICRKGDVNGDGIVDSKDAIMVLQFIVGLKTLTDTQKCSADIVEDGEIKANDVIKILHIAVGSAAPKDHVNLVRQSRLFQNFPNPFNPETWIPYQLENGSEVVIKIFNTNGDLIRELILGYKPAGIYTSQDRSAYWDGKDEYGRSVASGVYFYSIQAGDFFAIKKMIVLR